MNLSIFNFERIISTVEKWVSLPAGSLSTPLSGYTISARFFIYPLIGLIILIIVFRLVRRLKTSWRNVVRAVLVLLILRIILFYNPVSWALYALILDTDDIGWRQRDIIKYELKRYLDKPPQVNYLAVGTSQTGAVYRNWARSHDDFVRFYLSGFGLPDLMLYRDFILSYHPRCLLLWLSEFDIAHAPAFDAIKIAPPQWGYWPTLFGRIHAVPFWDQADSALIEMLVGEFFPEYKYSFVFKGITGKLFGRNKALARRRITTIPDGESLETQLEILTTSLELKNVTFNLSFLKDFLQFVTKRDISVVIVEGQYNPIAYTPKNLDLNKIVRQRLKKLSSEFKDVYFVSRGAITEFTEDQYRDAYHVKTEEGLHFTEQLLNYLQSNVIE